MGGLLVRTGAAALNRLAALALATRPERSLNDRSTNWQPCEGKREGCGDQRPIVLSPEVLTNR